MTRTPVVRRPQVHQSTGLAVSLGLGRGTGRQSLRFRSLDRLFRTLDRLTRLGYGYYDIEPGHADSDPCITIWATIGLVPARISHTWLAPMQQSHGEDLAALHRAAA